MSFNGDDLSAGVSAEVGMRASLGRWEDVLCRGVSSCARSCSGVLVDDCGWPACDVGCIVVSAWGKATARCGDRWLAAHSHVILAPRSSKPPMSCYYDAFLALCAVLLWCLASALLGRCTVSIHH